MHPAEFWRIEGKLVRCELCPHACRIKAGELGTCGVRRHQDGQLWAEAYGLISSLALDPVEKKPLFHVKPGSAVLSLGSSGCNFRCRFCQNWSISQARPPLTPLTPEQVAAEAEAQDAVGVAYTYNEPLINLEYVRDCAAAVKRRGRLNLMVTNGYVQPGPLQTLLPLIDAWNIDLKSIRPEFYREFCGAELEPVLATIRAAAAVSHVELTHLVVTQGNDREADLAALVDWVASVSPEIPLHLSRYFPQYQWKAEPTAEPLLHWARDMAKQKLHWVYLGNLRGQDEDTLCPKCRTRLVERQGYSVQAVRVLHNQCPRCHTPVPGIF